MSIRNKLNLKERLNKGQSIIGTWCEIPSPELVNVLAKAGLDFIIIDMEHGATDFVTASQMIMAAEADGCDPIIRVSRNNESDILKALEISPQGIIIPHIETVEDRINAINFMKFPPEGKRSLNPYTRAGGYRVTPNFTTAQNKKLLSCLIIEGENGILNMEAIINDKNVDLIYIGTYDISSMLKIPGDTKNPEVLKILKKLVKIIRQKGKIAACMFHDEQELKLFRQIGIQMLCYKVDTNVIFDAFNKIKFQ